MSDNINEKIREFFHRNAGYIIVLLVSAAYVATSILELNESGKSLMRIIGDGAVAFIVGCAINIVLGLQGMMNGEREDIFKQSIRLHAETVEKITPFIDKLDPWCEEKNRENLKNQRTRILALEGLSYSECFTDEGVALPFVWRENPEKADEKAFRQAEYKRYQCYRRAVRLKLTPLSAGELTSEGSKADDPYDFGRNKMQYERETERGEILSRVLTALVFGYYSASMLTDFSYDKLVWNLLQVAIFIITGTVKMYKSYLFITGEYRGRIVKKVNSLEMFYNDTKEGEKNNGRGKSDL